MTQGKQYPFHELRMIINAARAKAEEIQATLNRGPAGRRQIGE